MNKNQLLKFHIGFWLFKIFFGDVLNLIGDKTYTPSLAKFTHYFYNTSLVFQILGTYGVLWVVNRYFDKKEFVKMTMGIVGVILSYVIVRYFMEEWVALKIWGVTNYDHGESFTFLYYATDSFYNGLNFIFNAVFFKMVNDFFKNEKIKNDLKNEKMMAELAFLKSQLNPHFLFNTLNNIYTLTYQKSDEAPKAMMKLSEIMRYMLYESNEDRVDLQKEVKYLENMIDLQRMRVQETTTIQTNFQGQMEGKRIAPLLLVPFVENAFKHGELSDIANPLIINLLVSQNNVHFSVRNKIRQQNKDAVGGIGLENVKRRLNLLYPDKYSLETQEADGFYQCELNLML